MFYRPNLTPYALLLQEYYEADQRFEDGRLELVEDRIVAMTNGSQEHGFLIATLRDRLIVHTLGSSCRVYQSEQRVRASLRRVYPDIVVVCGQLQLDPTDPYRRTATNPRVIVEVLSPSTRKTDLGDKLNAYREIGSLRDYVIVEQEERLVVVYSRESEDQHWAYRQHGPSGKLAIPSLGFTLDVEVLYSDRQETQMEGYTTP